MTTVLVQLAEPEWTQEALHLACALARKQHHTVSLLRLLLTDHLYWLGVPGADVPSYPETRRDWQTYCEIAAIYSVELNLQPVQCASYVGGLIDAADQLDASILFAQIPESRLPLLDRAQGWWLRRELARHGRSVYLLDQPTQSIYIAVQFGIL